jgi:hypothetical protein
MHPCSLVHQGKWAVRKERDKSLAEALHYYKQAARNRCVSACACVCAAIRAILDSLADPSNCPPDCLIAFGRALY